MLLIGRTRLRASSKYRLWNPVNGESPAEIALKPVLLRLGQVLGRKWAFEVPALTNIAPQTRRSHAIHAPTHPRHNSVWLLSHRESIHRTIAVGAFG